MGAYMFFFDRFDSSFAIISLKARKQDAKRKRRLNRKGFVLKWRARGSMCGLRGKNKRKEEVIRLAFASFVTNIINNWMMANSK